MLDEFRNISILNHFLQNVTCSMWADTIGHFESPTEDIIRDAVAYSGEGAHEGDL